MERVEESWELSTHKDGESVVADGYIEERVPADRLKFNFTKYVILIGVINKKYKIIRILEKTYNFCC